jgi:hypothetical protein
MIALRVRHDSRVVHEAVFSLLPVEGQAVESARFEGPLVVRIGKTDIEIEPVADRPALEIPVAGRRPETRRRGAPASLVYLALGVAGILTGKLLDASFWSPWNHTRWVGLVRDAITSGLALPLAAGALFLVLKVIGRRVRMADTLRALALLTWLVSALGVVFLAAYYPLAPSQLTLFQGTLAAVAAAVGVAILASVRREPRSLAFTAGWAAAVLVVIAGLATMAAMNSRQTGEPSVDLNLQAPIAGYAGRAESFDDYLSAVRSAARSSENGREQPAQGPEDPKAAALR